MVLRDTGKFRKEPRAESGRVTIPSDLVKDSQFPLVEGDVEISIVGDHLEVKMCK